MAQIHDILSGVLLFTHCNIIMLLSLSQIGNYKLKRIQSIFRASESLQEETRIVFEVTNGSVAIDNKDDLFEFDCTCNRIQCLAV